MQINNNYSPKFLGAYRIRPNALKAKSEIPKLFTKHRQIFSDIKEQGDMFLILRNNSSDMRLLRYIKDNEIKGVEYFPTINTKSGLDDEHPEVLKDILLSGKHKGFSKIQQIASLISQNAGNRNSNEDAELLSKIINAMRLNIENPKISVSDKMVTVRDDAKKRTLYVISPNYAINYALLRYDNHSGNTMRYTIDKNGNIIKEHSELEAFLAFDKKFSKLAKSEINILKP